MITVLNITTHMGKLIAYLKGVKGHAVHGSHGEQRALCMNIHPSKVSHSPLHSLQGLHGPLRCAAQHLQPPCLLDNVLSMCTAFS